MHFVPSWFPFWQSLDGLLGIFNDAAMTLPFMAALALYLGRRKGTAGFSEAGRICCRLALPCAGLSLVEIAARAFMDMRVLPSVLPKLEPLDFVPFSAPWLSVTSAFLTATLSFLLLLAATVLVRSPLTGTAKDVEAYARARKNAAASILCFVATLLFFAVIILRNWPFMGFPEQMTQETVVMVLLRHAWHAVCASFMPSGALAILAFYMTNSAARAALHEKPTAGKAIDLAELFGEQDILVLRTCCSFAIAGAAFHILDAGFLAFSSPSMAGVGVSSTLLRFGPFFVTALGLTCWIFLFARPRKRAILFAFLPVLLIVARALMRF